MRKEIGSEFDVSINILLKDSQKYTSFYNYNLFIEEPKDIVYLSNGRTAIKFVLSHILKRQEIRKCWLPGYLCETMIQPFKELKLDYEFYNIKEGLELDTKYLSNRVKKRDLIFLTYYFGFPQSDEVLDFLYEIKSLNIVILEDITQSFLTDDIRIKRIGNYSIISIRKWFGIPEGGIAISFNDLFDKDLLRKEPFYEFVYLRLMAALLKNLYLNEIIQEKDYFRQMFKRAEELANSNIGLNIMSELSIKILNSIDFKVLINKRRENFLFLLSNINDLNKITPLYKELKEGVCPLGFPIVVPQRDLLRAFLTSNSIFCPIHWIIPSEIPSDFSYAHYLSQNILTIPCDQRYSTNDMEIIVNKVKRFSLGG